MAVKCLLFIHYFLLAVALGIVSAVVMGQVKDETATAVMGVVFGLMQFALLAYYIYGRVFKKADCHYFTRTLSEREKRAAVARAEAERSK